MFAISYLFFQIFLQFILLARSDEDVVENPVEIETITNPKDQNPNDTTSSNPLDNLVKLNDMFGIDLKTATYIIAALGVVHVFFYGCTLFMPLSYMLVSMWVLVVLYSVFSAILFVSLMESDWNSIFMLNVWIWYALIFVPLMFLMMLLVAMLFVVKSQSHRLFIVLLGIAWYTLTLYFIFVVNSYRMQLSKEADNINVTATTTSSTASSSTISSSTTTSEPPPLVMRSVKDWKNEISLIPQ